MQDLLLSKLASIWWVNFSSHIDQNHWSQDGSFRAMLENWGVGYFQFFTRLLLFLMLKRKRGLNSWKQLVVRWTLIFVISNRYIIWTNLIHFCALFYKLPKLLLHVGVWTVASDGAIYQSGLSQYGCALNLVSVVVHV